MQWEIIKRGRKLSDKITIKRGEKRKSQILYIPIKLRRELNIPDYGWVMLYRSDVHILIQMLSGERENSRRLMKGRISFPKYLTNPFWNGGSMKKTIEFKFDGNNLVLDLKSLKEESNGTSNINQEGRNKEVR